jgi:8-oxo-dGTP pyrophosphatase MutT (NUDIX family)
MVSILLIVKDKRFLFFKRSSQDTSYPNHWGLAGGGVDKGETPNEGLVREIKEELGFTLTDYRLLNRYDLNGLIANVYVCDSPDFDESMITLNNEHTEYRYFTYNEVINSKDFIPSNTRFITDYLKSI